MFSAWIKFSEFETFTGSKWKCEVFDSTWLPETHRVCARTGYKTENERKDNWMTHINKGHQNTKVWEGQDKEDRMCGLTFFLFTKTMKQLNA